MDGPGVIQELPPIGFGAVNDRSGYHLGMYAYESDRPYDQDPL